jgi:predicted transcriptional regulator
MAEKGYDAFTIANLLGHSDIRVTMRYVRMVEGTKRAAVESVQLADLNSGQFLATLTKQPPLPMAVNA